MDVLWKHCLKILSVLYAWIPSFARFGLISKISITILLAGFCADFFYAKIDPAVPLLKGALTFSPVKYAEGLVEKGQLKTAEQYIQFYQSLPGTAASQELQELENKIHKTRTGIVSGTLHQGKHIIKGIKGEESDEMVAQAANAAIDFTGASDVRDLYKEWQNYSAGREVDKLSAGLAGIGLTMTLGEYAGGIAGFVTGGASAAGAITMFEPVRKMCLGIRKALKFMNPKLKKACQNLFEPVFKKISKLKLLDNLPINKLPAGSVKDRITGLKNLVNPDQITGYLKKHMEDIEDIAKMAKSKLSTLGEIASVARQNPYAAKLIAENAGNIKSVSSLSKMALELGDNGRAIFHFGGKNALEAMSALGKQGKLSATTLKQSMRVGENGLKAVAKKCWRSLDKMVELAQKSKPLLWWFMTQWFLSKIPLWLALLVEVAIIAVLLKSWLSWLMKSVRQPA